MQKMHFLLRGKVAKNTPRIPAGQNNELKNVDSRSAFIGEFEIGRKKASQTRRRDTV